MEDIARRLVRYQRLISPEAHSALASSPGLLDRLEVALEDGVDLPLIIERSHLDELTTDKMSDIVIESPSPITRSVVNSSKIPIKREETKNSDPVLTIPLDPNKDKPSRKKKEEEIDITPDIGINKEAFAPKIQIDPISRSVSDILKHKIPSSTSNLRTTGPRSRPRPLAAEYDGDLKIIKDTLATMGGQGKIDDFKKLFMDRYRSMRELLLRQYGALHPCADIANLRGAEDAVRFIGIIESVRTTKNGHTMLNLEDPTGNIRVLISKKKKDLSSIRLVNDEVIGVGGKYKGGDGRGGPIVFADQLLKVDIPGNHQRRLSEVKGLSAAFTSDIHIGSKMYLEKDWNKMVKWLRGERDASMPAKDGTRVKYLVLAGDLVDGIGTYPDQDKDLLIKDIFKQYEALGESLSMLPEHLEIVMLPGNHDAVRLAEPQPPIPKEFQECFSNSHLHFLPNPAFFSIHGVHVTGYHGRSMDDLVTLFKDVTYEDPIEGMKEMLRFRHFSPTYGMRNQISPEEKDNLIIEGVPDIFVSGHVHRFGMDYYKGIQLIEGSTWQSQTNFQKMMNFKPQPSRMGIVELDLPDSMQEWRLT